MHPILLKIGPIQLYTYGAFLATAFVLAIYISMRFAEREGLNPDMIADLGIVVILSAIVGSRIFYILFYNLEYTLKHPRSLLTLQQTGLVFYGGFILALVASVTFLKVKKAPIPIVLDILAPVLALGQSIGRIGCFMSGCCYGKPWTGPLAVQFPHLDHLRHPTQIYESVAMFGVFLVLLWFRKRRTRAGQVALLYVILYAPTRFGIEFFRGDNPEVLMGLTISQVVSVLALAGAIAVGAFLYFSKRGENPQDEKRT
jgi:phosphatidylglycerol:prolipoprotein diacylglycerol transferase